MVLLTPRFLKIDMSSNLRIESLGSDHERKYIVISILGPEPLLVSDGVGDDIIFDVEFISRYSANVKLIDPLPRAIEHISAVTTRLGEENQSSYSGNGKQSPDSYDLTKSNSTNLTFDPCAMLDAARKARFYEPPISD